MITSRLLQVLSKQTGPSLPVLQLHGELDLLVASAECQSSRLFVLSDWFLRSVHSGPQLFKCLNLLWCWICGSGKEICEVRCNSWSPLHPSTTIDLSGSVG